MEGGREEEGAIGIEGVGKGMGGVCKGRGCGHTRLSEKRDGDTQDGRWWASACLFSDKGEERLEGCGGRDRTPSFHPYDYVRLLDTGESAWIEGVKEAGIERQL